MRDGLSPKGSDCTQWPSPGLCSLTGLEAILVRPAFVGRKRPHGINSQPESIARDEVVADEIDEIGVHPSGDGGTAKKVESDLDSGIDKNLSGMLEQHWLKDDVTIRRKQRSGYAKTRCGIRVAAEICGRVSPRKVSNVKQVVNEVEVKKNRPAPVGVGPLTTLAHTLANGSLRWFR